jgi:hypothetical protein
MLDTIHKIAHICKERAWEPLCTHASRVGDFLGIDSEERVREFARACIVVSVGFGACGVGFLAGRERAPHVATLDTTHRVPYLAEIERAPEAALAVAQNGKTIVASRHGKKYYGTRCSGASRITPKNRRYFTDASAAQKAGYSKASNCAGLH